VSGVADRFSFLLENNCGRLNAVAVEQPHGASAAWVNVPKIVEPRPEWRVLRLLAKAQLPL
jgi:hypothetical protein